MTVELNYSGPLYSKKGDATFPLTNDTIIIKDDISKMITFIQEHPDWDGFISVTGAPLDYMTISNIGVPHKNNDLIIKLLETLKGD